MHGMGKSELIKVISVLTTPESLGFLKGQSAFIHSHGFEVHAVSSPGLELEHFGESEGVMTHGVPMTRRISPLSDIVAITRLFRLFRRERPQIVHTHTPKANLVAGIAACLARVPCRIVHLHGLPHSTAAGLARTILRWSTRVPCMLATEVLAVSQSVAGMAVNESLCAASRIKVLGNGSANGVDMNRFCPDAVASRLKRRALLGLSETDLVVGFAGRLVRDKGVTELLAAWERIRDEFPTASLVIAGQPEQRDALPLSVLQGLQADPRVKLLGQFLDMPGFYACLDVFALPTYREGLPTVILESAAMAVPAVASDCVGCVDAVENGVTGILVPPGDSTALADAIRSYLNNPDLRRQHGLNARTRILRDFRSETVWQAMLEEYRRTTRPGSPPRRLSWATFSKRSIDIALSFVGLVLLSPLIAILAMIVRLSLGRPVFFRQVRPGLNERPFQLIKFRSMRDTFDRDGRPLPDSERLTSLGRFLRKSSLDELPELWNVLKGDMSLVGPRPLLTHYLGLYDAVQRRRHAAKPGITGWAQVCGRNTLNWDERLRLDVWYVDHQSFLLDLQILWRTVAVVLQAEGITQPGHATMPEFVASVKSSADAK